MTATKCKSRKCEECGAIYPVFASALLHVNKRGNICSKECRASRRMKLNGINCKQCGKRYVSYFKKVEHCSRKCAYLSSRTKDRIACKVCGNDFRQDKPTHAYCSTECYAKSMRDASSRKCVFCGKMFYRHDITRKQKRHAGPHHNSFCSRRCNFRSKSLTKKIRLAQIDFQKRLGWLIEPTLKPPADEWERYCRREATKHRNENSKTFEKTWKQKINSMISTNRHRQSMREEIEARPKKTAKAILNPREKTWAWYVKKSMMFALTEVKRATEKWQIKCVTWAGNQRKRIRRKAAASRARNLE